MTKMSYIDTVLCKNSNYDESTDAIVSDLFEDISEIIMVSGNVFIKDTSIQSDRILISGDIKCEVLYIPEQSNTPTKMDINMNFAHIEELHEPESLVFVNANLANISARIINPRKISVLANINLETKAYKNRDIKIDENKLENLEVLANFKEVLLIDSVNICKFELNDEISFNGIETLGNQVTNLKPRVNINDVKLLKNKLMLRGNIDFSGFMIENDDFMPINANTSFSQILDIDINDEKLEPTVYIKVVDFSIDDNSYSINAECCLVQKKMEKVQIIEDLYDKDYEIDIKQNELNLTNSPKYIEETYDICANIETSELVDSIIMTEVLPFATPNENGKYDLFANISGVYKDEQNLHNFSQKYKFTENVEGSNIEFYDTNIRCNKKSNSVIEVLGNIKAKKYNDQKMSILVIDEVNKICPKTKLNDEIVLKFVSSNQKIWDIAKSYSVKESDILEANQMTSDTKFIANQMILIPRK